MEETEIKHLCECGCGQEVKDVNRRFIHGHNFKVKGAKRNDSKGPHNPSYGTHMKEESKIKMRRTFEERSVSKGVNNPMFGNGWRITKAFKDGKYKNRPNLHQNYKGKTLEEIYGDTQALIIRYKMSNSAVKKCKLYPEILIKARSAAIEVFRKNGFPAQKPEQRIKSSIRITKENNPMWKGGISKEPYSFDFDLRLKAQIKERDGYICQLCSCSNPIKLSIHHIDYDKKNSNYYNLITLCRSCNVKVNINRPYWTNYFYGIVRYYENFTLRV